MRILLALALLAAPAGDVTIVTAERGNLIATRISMASENGVLTLQYADAAGSQKIRADEVVEIRIADAAPPASPKPAMVEVELTSGDRILGLLAKGEEYTVRVRTDLLGDLVLKFEQIRAIRSVLNSAVAPPRPDKMDEDLVSRADGDKGKGYLISLDESEVVYHSSPLDRRLKVPLSNFAAAHLTAMPDALPPRAPATLFAILLARDAGMIQGEIRSLQDGVLVFQDLYGTERKVDVSRLASIYFKNGRVVYVSDLPPSSVEENANYIRAEKPMASDLSIPWRADRNVRGGALSLRGKNFRKGLGVHAYSSLTYDIAAGGYTRFHATIGLDDCGEGRGHVAFQVFVDGEKKLEKAVDGAEAPVDVSLDVAGAKSLRLVVDFGERANMADYADWAAARLIR